MIYENNMVKDLKIAYIGGGSRGWAWILMNDLKKAANTINGTVYLYDIDYAAAQKNEVIGNRIDGEGWKYKAVETIGEALTGADFVIVSILPGTFDEMQVDVHVPEKYGLLQSTGDTVGAGGFIRALRTIPQMREIARNIRTYCPEATVLNYTNPMAVCVGALYREFPQIKAYGCCHEVFNTQKLLMCALKEMEGIETTREKICVNVVGVNHFTWFSDAKYQNMDLYPIYTRFVDKFYESGFSTKYDLQHWVKAGTGTNARVRMDLFKRYGIIAAAGDRHLAEFMPNADYLGTLDNVKKWQYNVVTVPWRKKNLVELLERSDRLYSGEEVYELVETGEEGVQQITALLGLSTMVTNINIPNDGQISNLPIGTIVETNAAFRDGSFRPVFAGKVPDSIYPLISRCAQENDDMLDAGFSQDLEYAYTKFRKMNMLEPLTEEQKRALYDEMIEGTKAYLGDYK